ncbi:MAG: endonuclease MutS2 [Lachnospiraceae bacterium]|nr:endonuclease MutS2 [Lachnospiraceae bacterium]
MNKKTLEILEYDKLIKLLTEKASSELGKSKCASLHPHRNREAILNSLQDTSDALARTLAGSRMSFGGNRNLSECFKAMSVEAGLDMAELLMVADSCECASRAKEEGLSLEREDSLKEKFESLIELSELSREIRRVIVTEDEIADDASPALKDIRREKRLSASRIHTDLNKMVNSTYRTYLQDAVITMRNDRYCIPVKAEYKGSVRGIVHDQSKGGMTFFIEPEGIVELNNRIQELEAEEREEINRILHNLSKEAATHLEDLKSNQEVLSELDFIFAKAKLAIDQEAVIPDYESGEYLDIKRARHPFIDKNKVVPIDILLGENYSCLIVTGPNTGGKTVSLKTTGLLCAMGQSGLFIPAAPGSKLRIFRDIYAEIGDEQSIEESLSTFSGHMRGIVSILKEANHNSLCLFDELCSGTDPTEGAALAIAIVSRLMEKRATVMLTTHYAELKVFALNTEGVENACCEFDVETLSPTYRLYIGIAGKSNAFAISEKLGLDTRIIERAKQEMDDSREDFEDLLKNLEESRRSIEEDREEAARLRAEVEKLKEELDKNKESAKESREKILREAREEAKSILEDAKEEADEAIRLYNAGTSIQEMEKKRALLRKKIDDNSSRIKKEEKKPENTGKRVNKDTLKIGDRVHSISMGMDGDVKKLPDSKGKVTIASGIMEFKVGVEDLIYAKEEVVKEPSRTTNYASGFSKSASISPEINLLGLNSDEAVAKLDKYLDDAYLSHLHSVRVVHGKGTGALRAAIHKYLRHLDFVDEFKLAEQGEGDAGVTVVVFK